MTQDEIRRLLGGYASDTLTDDERRVLFKAALEDQDLFNALQNEDALKELLADPVTRGQLRAALEHRARTRKFPWRRWVLGVAAPAAIAIAVVLVMNRANAPKLVAIRPAAPEVAPAPAPFVAKSSPPATPPVLKKRTAPRKATPSPAPVPAPAPEATAALEARAPAVAPAPAVTMFRAGGGSPLVSEAVRQQISAGLAKDAALYQGPLLRYSLVRSGRDDRAVQVEVTSGIAGYLALYEVDAAGNTKRVYPAGEEASRLLPNAPTQIPANPITVAEGSRLRLVLAPAPPPAAGGFLGGAPASLATGNAQAPLVVDIPVGP